MSDKLLEIAGASTAGGFSVFLGGAISTVILAVGSILIARMLGPAGYGLYALAFVTPSLLGSLVGFGLDDAMVRFLAKFRAEGHTEIGARLLKSGLSFKIMITLVASLIGFLFSDFFAVYLLRRPELAFYLKVASFLVLFQGIFSLATYAFIGLDKMEKNALLSILMSLVRTPSAVILILLGLGVAGAVLGFLLGYIVAAAAGITILFPWLNGSSTSRGSDGGFVPDIKLMVGYGFPLYLSSLFAVLVGQFQLVLLAYYVSNLDIGNFNAALNFTVLISLVMTPVALAIFPAFSKLNPKQEAAELRRFFAGSAKYTSLLIIPISVAVMIFSSQLVRVVYGASYQLAPAFLSLYSVGFLYAGIGSVLGSFFNGVGETKLNLKISIINSAVFIPLALLLTDLLRIPGLIVAFVASGFVSLLYGLLIARKNYAVSVGLAAQAKICLAVGLSALPALFFLELSPFGNLLNLLLGGALYLVTYLTIIPMLRAIRLQDIDNLKVLFSKIKIVWPLLRLMLAYESKVLSAL